MKKLVLVALLFIASFSFAQTQQSFVLYEESGKALPFEDILNNGRSKVFVFWSGYCIPCKYEMRGLTNLSKNWLNDYNAEVYFVSLNNYGYQAYQQLKFIEEFKNDGQYQLFDPNRELYQFFNGSSFPTTILLDNENNLIQKWNGYDDGLERSIEMYFQKLYRNDL